jgi:hypothetical protein
MKAGDDKNNEEKIARMKKKKIPSLRAVASYKEMNDETNKYFFGIIG